MSNERCWRRRALLSKRPHFLFALLVLLLVYCCCQAESRLFFDSSYKQRSSRRSMSSSSTATTTSNSNDNNDNDEQSAAAAPAPPPVVAAARHMTSRSNQSTRHPPPTTTTATTTTTTAVPHHHHHHHRDPVYMYSSLAAGIGSGVVSSLICAPLDLIRTRLQVFPSSAHNMSMLSMLRDILRHDGLAGCFRGLTATLLTVPVFWGVYCAYCFVVHAFLWFGVSRSHSFGFPLPHCFRFSPLSSHNT